GTVWGWLIGPFIDAWLKVHPEDQAGARRSLEAMMPQLDHACVGSISEIFDAEEPYTPRGCIAQAWSVAEALRCWVKTAEDVPPTPSSARTEADSIPDKTALSVDASTSSQSAIANSPSTIPASEI